MTHRPHHHFGKVKDLPAQTPPATHRGPRASRQHNRSNFKAVFIGAGLVLAGVGVASAVTGGINKARDLSKTEALTVPSATAAQSLKAIVPSASSSASPNQLLSPSATPVVVKDYLLNPVNFNTDPNNCRTIGKMSVGAFTLRATVAGQVQQFAVPASEMLLSSCGTNVVETQKNLPTIDAANQNAVMKQVTIKQASILKNAALSKPPTIVASVISHAQILKEETNGYNICVAAPHAEGCDPKVKVKSVMTAAQAKSLEASVQVILAMNVQQDCGAAESAALLGQFNDDLDTEAVALNISGQDVTAVYDTKTVPSYIAGFLAKEHALGAITDSKQLQATFGAKLAVPVTCNIT